MKTFAVAALFVLAPAAPPAEDEIAVEVDPFVVLVERWAGTGGVPAPAWGLAAAKLGHRARAESSIQATEARCASTPQAEDCVRAAEVNARVRAEVARLPPPSPAGASRPIPALAGRVPSSARTRFDVERDETTLASAPAALAPWSVTRLERAGDRVAAVSCWRPGRVDWDDLACALHVSSDGGASFAAPLPLGFAAYAPYVVRARSRVPLVDGDAVNVEVFRCLPEDGPAQPAVERGPPTCSDFEPTGHLLTYSLAALTRDTDGDGLTDAQEDWWALDPRSVDSDGDGEADAVDPSPRRLPIARAPEIDALVEWLTTDAPMTQLLALPHDGARASLEARPAARGVDPPRLQEPLAVLPLRPVPLFATGDPIRAPSGPGPRVIVATESEVPRLTPRWFGTRLDIVLDEEGGRAVVEYVLHDRGGAFVAERGPEGWKVVRGLGGWMS